MHSEKTRYPLVKRAAHRSGMITHAWHVFEGVGQPLVIRQFIPSLAHKKSRQKIWRL